jgi:phenylalanine-4-hydroxylase
MAQTVLAKPAAASDDWTVPQDWAAYTQAEHALWDQLFARQSRLLVGRATPAFPTSPNSPSV